MLRTSSRRDNQGSKGWWKGSKAPRQLTRDNTGSTVFVRYLGRTEQSYVTLHALHQNPFEGAYKGMMPADRSSTIAGPIQRQNQVLFQMLDTTERFSLPYKNTVAEESPVTALCELFDHINTSIPNNGHAQEMLLTCEGVLRHLHGEDVEEKTDPMSIKEGWLWKEGEKKGSSKNKRYFILYLDRMLYFKSKPKQAKADKQAQGVIPLTGGATVSISSSKDFYPFSITPALSSGRVYYIFATYNLERQSWVQAIKTVIALDKSTASANAAAASSPSSASASANATGIPGAVARQASTGVSGSVSDSDEDEEEEQDEEDGSPTAPGRALSPGGRPTPGAAGPSPRGALARTDKNEVAANAANGKDKQTVARTVSTRDLFAELKEDGAPTPARAHSKTVGAVSSGGKNLNEHSDKLNQAAVDLNKNGYLHKLGAVRSNWKKRWFTLSSDKLEYYVDEKKEKKGEIKLTKSTVIDLIEPEMATTFLSILPNTFYIEPTPGSRIFYMSCRSDSERLEWIASIREVIELQRHQFSGFRSETPEEQARKRELARLQDQQRSAAVEKEGLGNSVKEGWLNKEGLQNKAKKRRYFVLYRDRLLYFKSKIVASKGISAAKGSVLLFHNSSVQESEKLGSFVVVPFEGSRTYQITADNNTEREVWVSKIREQIAKLTDTHNPANKEEAKSGPRISSFSIREGFMVKTTPAVGPTQKYAGKRRYFVLLPSELLIYQNKNQFAPPIGVIPLYQNTKIDIDAVTPHALSLTPYDGARTFVLQCSSDEERGLWQISIAKVLTALPNARPEEKMSSSSLREGWLFKDAEDRQIPAKKRYFVLFSDKLLYFKMRFVDTMMAPLGFIPLFSDSVIATDPSRPGGFTLTPFPEGRVYRLQAESDIKRDDWLKQLQGMLVGLTPSNPLAHKDIGNVVQAAEILKEADPVEEAQGVLAIVKALFSKLVPPQKQVLRCLCPKNTRPTKNSEKTNCLLHFYKAFRYHDGNDVLLRLWYGSFANSTLTLGAPVQEEGKGWILRSLWVLSQHGELALDEQCRSPFADLGARDSAISVYNVMVVTDANGKRLNANYVIRIAVGSKVWFVLKKFKELTTFYDALSDSDLWKASDTQPALKIPKLDTSFVLKPTSDEAIEKRKESLSTFFNELTGEKVWPRLLRSPIFRIFFKCDDHLTLTKGLSRRREQFWQCVDTMSRNTESPTMSANIMTALFEILMGKMSQPSDLPRKLGDMGFATPIAEKFVLPLILLSLQASDPFVCLQGLENINLLIIMNADNARTFLEHPDWQKWMLPFLMREVRLQDEENSQKPQLAHVESSAGPPPGSGSISSSSLHSHSHNNSAGHSTSSNSSQPGALAVLGGSGSAASVDDLAAAHAGRYCNYRPESAGDGLLRMTPILGHSMMLLVNVHKYNFASSTEGKRAKLGMKRLLLRTVTIIGRSRQWDVYAVSLVRMFLDSFVKVIMQETKEFALSLTQPAWKNLWMVLDVYGKFLFYKPILKDLGEDVGDVMGVLQSITGSAAASPLSAAFPQDATDSTRQGLLLLTYSMVDRILDLLDIFRFDQKDPEMYRDSSERQLVKAMKKRGLEALLFWKRARIWLATSSARPSSSAASTVDSKNKDLALDKLALYMMVYGPRNKESHAGGGGGGGGGGGDARRASHSDIQISPANSIKPDSAAASAPVSAPTPTPTPEQPAPAGASAAATAEAKAKASVEREDPWESDNSDNEEDNDSVEPGGGGASGSEDSKQHWIRDWADQHSSYSSSTSSLAPVSLHSSAPASPSNSSSSSTPATSSTPVVTSSPASVTPPSSVGSPRESNIGIGSGPIIPASTRDQKLAQKLHDDEEEGSGVVKLFRRWERLTEEETEEAKALEEWQKRKAEMQAKRLAQLEANKQKKLVEADTRRAETLKKGAEVKAALEQALASKDEVQVHHRLAELPALASAVGGTNPATKEWSATASKALTFLLETKNGKALQAAPQAPRQVLQVAPLLQAKTGYLDWKKHVFAIEQLRAGTGEGIDPNLREMYLDEAEFEKLFKTTKAEWSGLPQWTRNLRKKAFGITVDVKPTVYQLKRQFEALDIDHSGGLEEDELRDYIQKLTGTYIDHEVFAKMDKNGSGKIEFTEFVQLVRPIVDLNVLKLQKEFQLLDKDHSGGLDFEEVSDYYMKVKGFKPTQAIFASFDKNKSGKIEFPEFVRLLRPVVEEGLPLLFAEDDTLSEADINTASKVQPPPAMASPVTALEVASFLHVGPAAKIHHSPATTPSSSPQLNPSTTPPSPPLYAKGSPGLGPKGSPVHGPSSKSPPTSPLRERPGKK